MRQLLGALLFLFLAPLTGLQAQEEPESRFDYFYMDSRSSNQEFIRLAVPIATLHWFAFPMSVVASLEEIGTEEVEGECVHKVRVVFINEQLNSILGAYNDLDEEFLITRWPPSRPHWPPRLPSTKCGICKLKVNLFITGSVFAATLAAGVTGPGAYAIWQAMVISAYGTAAWEAVKAVIFSASVDVLSKKICEAYGKCS